jgi:hypothetical protein
MSVDSGYPKKLFDGPSGYDLVYPMDCIRDRQGNFWVVGAVRATSTTYWRHWVAKLDSDWNLITDWKGESNFSNINWESQASQTRHRAVSGIGIRSNDEVYICLNAVNTSDSEDALYVARLSNLDDTSWDVFKDVSDDKNSAGTHNPFLYNQVGLEINGDNDVCIFWRGTGYDSRSYTTAICCFRIYKSSNSWTSTGYLADDQAGYGAGPPSVVASQLTSSRFYSGSYFGGSGGNVDIKIHYFDTPAGSSISFNLVRTRDNYNARTSDGMPRKLVISADESVQYVLLEDVSTSNAIRIIRNDSVMYYPTVRRNYNYVIAYSQESPEMVKFCGYDDFNISKFTFYEKVLLSAHNLGWATEDQVSLTNIPFICPVCHYNPINSGKRYGIPLEGYLFVLSQNNTEIWGISFDNLTWEEVTIPTEEWISFGGVEEIITANGKYPSIVVDSSNNVYITWVDI